MVKFNWKASALALTAACAFAPAFSQGWPAQHEGVMLQGFYWDSYKGNDNTKWSTLTSKADELSKYFNLIWIPNSAKAASNPGMGYDPVYWFSNHTTAFGTESQLRTMISTFKEKGTGIIADVVINHRSGVSNWTNFPKETWNGETFQLGPEHICCNDEVAYASGQAKPTGAYDTGDNFDGSRDLDHTNSTVQYNCKKYCQFLLEELGYAGFRYDMVKGYGGQYTKIYNQYSKPTYSVGEYWDGSYDALKRWIEATGRTSAAFDFAFKYAVNEAFANRDYSKLVWKANWTTDQPAGLIHYEYPRYAVTFVDNHDTYRDGSKFNGNVLAANAFMLACPGTPCVFYPHWVEYAEQLKPMIQARLDAGVHNESPVKVLRTGNGVYMAETTGKYGTMVVKIGSEAISPEGYSNSDIRCTGNDYCIWVKTNGTPIPPTPVDPDPVPGDGFTVYYNNAFSGWATPHIHYWGASASSWPGVAMTKVEGQVWKYEVPAGTTGLLFNAGDGDNTKTPDFVAVANHIYTQAGDQGVYEGNVPVPDNYPATLYLIGNLPEGDWNTATAVAQDTKDGGRYEWNHVRINAAGTDTNGYFSFITALGSNWDVVNGHDRYGATSNDAPLVTSAGIKLFKGGVDASSAFAWKVQPGNYNIVVDLANNLITLSTSTSVNALENGGEQEVIYFDLQGRRIENPVKGMYIKVGAGKTEKVVVK